MYFYYSEQLYVLVDSSKWMAPELVVKIFNIGPQDQLLGLG